MAYVQILKQRGTIDKRGDQSRVFRGSSPLKNELVVTDVQVSKDEWKMNELVSVDTTKERVRNRVQDETISSSAWEEHLELTGYARLASNVWYNHPITNKEERAFAGIWDGSIDPRDDNGRFQLLMAVRKACIKGRIPPIAGQMMLKEQFEKEMFVGYVPNEDSGESDEEEDDNMLWDSESDLISQASTPF